MYLYVSILAPDILTLSPPTFVTQDKSTEKTQRKELIKEVKQEYQMQRFIQYKSQHVKTSLNTIQDLFFMLRIKRDTDTMVIIDNYISSMNNS